MKKIYLFCAGGMSTSLLVNKMKEAAAAMGKEYFIEAHGVGSVEKYIDDADCVLLGPQIAYTLKKVQADHPEKPIASIEMRTYGTMNGKAVLETAMKMMGDVK